jgi:aminoglycoside phosphotransferase (APT) family kinase protein
VTEQESPLLRAHELLRRSGLPPLQIQNAGRGSNHHLFVVELDEGPLQLLRMPVDRDSGPRLRSEEEAIRRASGTVPVPHPTLLIPSLHRPEACLQPIVEGTRAQDLRVQGPSEVRVDILCRHLGVQLAHLHRIEFPVHEPTFIPFLSPSFVTGNERLLHGDAHLGNLMVTRDAKGNLSVSGLIDWSFCHWGPPESDLVEMAITEAEPRPALGRVFFEGYLEAGGLEPREHVFKWALVRELERRLAAHAQAYEQTPRDRWTRWLDALHRPGAHALHIFDARRITSSGDLV